MNESWTVADIIEACTTYWRGAGVSADHAEEMRAEIEPHLEEAAAAGKSPIAVVGPDIAAFAESWAAV